MKYPTKKFNIQSITIQIASGHEVRSWAERTLPTGKRIGEVHNADTVRFQTFKPMKDGLFCERIFGPVKDFVCYCGKKHNQKGKKAQSSPSNRQSLAYCPECEVDITVSKERRYRLGFIKLNSMVTHIWFFKNKPSNPLPDWFEINKKFFELVTYCALQFVTHDYLPTTLTELWFLKPSLREHFVGSQPETLTPYAAKRVYWLSCLTLQSFYQLNKTLLLKNRAVLPEKAEKASSPASSNSQRLAYTRSDRLSIAFKKKLFKRESLLAPSKTWVSQHIQTSFFSSPEMGLLPAFLSQVVQIFDLKRRFDKNNKIDPSPRQHPSNRSFSCRKTIVLSCYKRLFQNAGDIQIEDLNISGSSVGDGATVGDEAAGSFLSLRRKGAKRGEGLIKQNVFYNALGNARGLPTIKPRWKHRAMNTVFFARKGFWFWNDKTNQFTPKLLFSQLCFLRSKIRGGGRRLNASSLPLYSNWYGLIFCSYQTPYTTKATSRRKGIQSKFKAGSNLRFENKNKNKTLHGKTFYPVPLCSVQNISFHEMKNILPGKTRQTGTAWGWFFFDLQKKRGCPLREDAAALFQNRSILWFEKEHLHGWSKCSLFQNVGFKQALKRRFGEDKHGPFIRYTFNTDETPFKKLAKFNLSCLLNLTFPSNQTSLASFLTQKGLPKSDSTVSFQKDVLRDNRIVTNQTSSGRAQPSLKGYSNHSNRRLSNLRFETTRFETTKRSTTHFVLSLQSGLQKTHTFERGGGKIKQHFKTLRRSRKVMVFPIPYYETLLRQQLFQLVLLFTAPLLCVVNEQSENQSLLTTIRNKLPISAFRYSQRVAIQRFENKTKTNASATHAAWAAPTEQLVRFNTNDLNRTEPGSSKENDNDSFSKKALQVVFFVKNVKKRSTKKLKQTLKLRAAAYQIFDLKTKTKTKAAQEGEFIANKLLFFIPAFWLSSSAAAFVVPFQGKELQPGDRFASSFSFVINRGVIRYSNKLVQGGLDQKDRDQPINKKTHSFWSSNSFPREKGRFLTFLNTTVFGVSPVLQISVKNGLNLQHQPYKKNLQSSSNLRFENKNQNKSSATRANNQTPCCAHEMSCANSSFCPRSFFRFHSVTSKRLWMSSLRFVSTKRQQTAAKRFNLATTKRTLHAFRQKKEGKGGLVKENEFNTSGNSMGRGMGDEVSFRRPLSSERAVGFCFAFSSGRFSYGTTEGQQGKRVMVYQRIQLFHRGVAKLASPPEAGGEASLSNLRFETTAADCSSGILCVPVRLTFCVSGTDNLAFSSKPTPPFLRTPVFEKTGSFGCFVGEATVADPSEQSTRSFKRSWVISKQIQSLSNLRFDQNLRYSNLRFENKNTKEHNVPVGPPFEKNEMLFQLIGLRSSIGRTTFFLNKFDPLLFSLMHRFVEKCWDSSPTHQMLHTSFRSNSTGPTALFQLLSSYFALKGRHSSVHPSMGLNSSKKKFLRIDKLLKRSIFLSKKQLKRYPTKQKRAVVRYRKARRSLKSFAQFPYVVQKKSPPNLLSSIFISALPVLPPTLRPIVALPGGVTAISDLNKLYQRILYRNIRLVKAPEVYFAQRMLQEAVDALIENGRGEAKPFTDAKNRPYKSLSDILQGKEGRFRQNLLGKRVDYSGRSVIVVGPKLEIYQCGLPLQMAKELFQPFLLRTLQRAGLVTNVIQAKRLIDLDEPIISKILHQLVPQYPVLLNRAPTLHRLGIQAFQPKIISGQTILLHPLVCTAFNADFDGDQMAVHIPLSAKARSEAWNLMWSYKNLFSPSTGHPNIVPTQDMVLGISYLTTAPSNSLSLNGAVFPNLREVINAYKRNLVRLQKSIWVKTSGGIETGVDGEEPSEVLIRWNGKLIERYFNFQHHSSTPRSLPIQYLLTTPGRVLMNQLIFSNL